MPNRDLSGSFYGVITEIDPIKYRAKVIPYPFANQENADNYETGFIKILCSSIGTLEAPSKGDLAKIDCMMNDKDDLVITGFFYNDVEIANSKDSKFEISNQKALPKWKIFRSRDSGAEVHIKDTGEIFIFTPEKIVIHAKKDIEIKSDAQVKIQASTAIIAQCNNVLLGSGTRQKLATEAFVQNFISSFNLHTHIGNLGAPTGTPLDLFSQGLNHTTLDTQAS